MYCPGCGLEERMANQFCRACGTDLRRVRSAIESSDKITASAVSARQEIGRAVAEQIRQTQSARELTKVAEDVLPQLEKFLESPEEKRLRRVRSGTIISSVGLGTAVAFTLVSIFVDAGALFIAGLGIVAFLIGLSFLINGLHFTIPNKSLSDHSSEGESQRELDYTNPQTNELVLPASNQVFTSVIEETTQQLKEKQPVLRQ